LAHHEVRAARKAEPGVAESAVFTHVFAAYLEHGIRLDCDRNLAAFGDAIHSRFFVEHHHVELRSAVHARDGALDRDLLDLFLKLDTFGKHCSRAIHAQVDIDSLPGLQA
jgi:hypothetical protein